MFLSRLWEEGSEETFLANIHGSRGTGRGTQVSPWASELLKQDSLSAHPCPPSLTLLGSRSCHLLLLVAGPYFLGADRREAPLPAGDIAFILASESLGITTLASEYNITTFF